jgi:hypothetical protein
MAKQKFVVYLRSIDQPCVFEPNASSKHALEHAYGKRWDKLPLIQKQIALRELNAKVEKKLLKAQLKDDEDEI